MFLQRLFRRLMRLRLYFFIAISVLGMLFAYFGTEILNVFVRHCDAPPTYQAGVPLSVRGEIDTLFTNDLLFCPEPKTPFDGLDGPIYWGSDGMRSALFFQADDLTGVGVTEYLFGQDFLVHSMGDSPPIGYGLIGEGEPIYRNEATEKEDGSRPTYFYRRDGAPQETDLQISISVRGAKPPAEGVFGSGDPFDDLELIWDRVRGVQSESVSFGSARASVIFPVLASDWEPLVRREVAPELATEEGEPSIERLSEAEFTEPIVFQRVTGLLGNSLWVAGVVTETSTAPTLILAGSDGSLTEPVRKSVWTSSRAKKAPLALFAFDPLPSDTPLEARYWHSASQAASTPPDLSWTVTFP